MSELVNKKSLPIPDFGLDNRLNTNCLIKNQCLQNEVKIKFKAIHSSTHSLIHSLPQ